jgi:tyrosinase
MSPVAQTRARATTTAVKLRLNAAHMSADEVKAYGDAVAAMQGQADNRGWQYYAGWHGIPQGWCEHGSPLFLPWHRSYLYHLELALQAHDPSVTIPWWDWMADAGIPQPFEGDQADNPLAGGPIAPIGGGGEDMEGVPSQTSRDPGAAAQQDPGVLSPPLQERYDWLMAPTEFLEFSRRCEALHNNMHVWTGGTMGDVPTAAFDPLFFSHHTMVDRLWRIWQVAHPGGTPPASMLGDSLRAGTRPIFTVREVLDVQALGYDYAASSASVPGTSGS